MIVEVANGPTSTDADVILNAKQTLVVPDILANAGGVTVSYFEWTQNRAGYCWTVDEVHERLHQIMTREFNTIYELMTTNQIDMRTSAYTHAFNRIGNAIEAQGTERFFSSEHAVQGR
ncbi:Catabolic NAD-specific glutamate dehydrogenase RocG [Stieleria magnilauensis]|uniref:Catabolic NAD-specific glutamate dehydrogenase RocG n=1 Tax=Stieleria magnilauensis TaxID=2527963 RepID=A0ABX5XTD7_9BACT|nr:Catabolic NAD-specific glutamate dehydrogenase RocG [Planctomycetes bacterium TBK1r]